MQRKQVGVEKLILNPMLEILVCVEGIWLYWNKEMRYVHVTIYVSLLIYSNLLTCFNEISFSYNSYVISKT